MTPALPRADVQQALRTRLDGGRPVLVTGPPGFGKTTVLLECARRLAVDGLVPVYLDLMGAASSPERFVRTALAALPPEVSPPAARRAAELAASREKAADAVQALFDAWSDPSPGGPAVALVLDAATEIRSLAYFPGLRDADARLAEALAARRQPTLMATSFPTLAARLWPHLEPYVLPPLGGVDVAPLAGPAGVDPAALAAAAYGSPRYARALLDGMRDGATLSEAWAAGMAPGGRLECLCRHTHEALLLRSRGYGISKALLATVADEEGLNLTALVARLGRSPGAVRDYLTWLVGVDALRFTAKRYSYVDPMLRWWVRLHGRGTPPSEADIAAAAHEATGSAPPPPPAARREPRRETLIEID